MPADQIIEGMNEYLSGSTKANYITVYEGFGIISNIANGLINILAAIIIIGIPLVVAIEVCYINFPNLEKRINEFYNESGERTQAIFGLFIRDAQLALERSRTTEYGKSANLIYLTIKCKAIFISVFILALVLGAGPIVIRWLWLIIKGFIDGIRSLM